MEAWQKPGEVNTGLAPRLSQHLPAGWGSPGGSSTQLKPGTEPDTSTRMLQTFMDRNSATAITASDVPRLRLASKSQKMAMNSTASLQQHPHSQTTGATVVPQQLFGLTASMQHFPVGFGELAHTASGLSILSQQEAHLGEV